MAEKIIKSLEKGIDLLFLFDARRRVLDVKEIASALRLPLRTTYRFVNTLRKCQVLALEEGTGRCRLSPKLRRLIAAIEESADIPRLAAPILADLAAKTGETVQLFLPSGDDAILVHVIESPHTLRIGPRTGQRVPLHCGAGAKPLLAFQSPEDWDGYIQRNGLKKHAPNTISDPEMFKRDLRKLRRTHVAITHQEFTPGARALGIPILDDGGAAAASLSVSGPDTRLTVRRARELVPLALQAAEQISMALTGGSAG
jgi:DNA-binding IclR family transcriptional regulator